MRKTDLLARKLLCCLVTTLLCAQGAQAQDGNARSLPVVTVATVTEQVVEALAPISGTVVPGEEVLVFPEVAGPPLRALLHDVGETVAQGDVLARLEDRTLASQLAQADAELARATAALGQARSQVASAQAQKDEAARERERAARLLESGAITQTALDQAVLADLTAQAAFDAARDGQAVAAAQVAQAQASRDIAALNLENAVIRAPVSGLITERLARVGALAGAAGEPMFRIVRDGVLEVEAEVIETELGRVTVGQTARLRIAGLDDLAGRVRRVSPTVDAQSRLGTIRITIGGDGLRPGLSATGSVVTTSRKGHAVPLSAIQSDAAGDYVLAVQDGLLSRKDIVVGIVSGDMREVVSGVEVGDIIVTRAAGFFAAGDRVQPVAAAESGK